MPEIKAVKTPNAPRALGPYSQATSRADTVYLSGQVPIDPKTNEIVDGDISAQTDQVLKNLKAVLKACGMEVTNIVKTTVYLTDLRDFEKMNEIYARHFCEPYPARATIEVSKLPKDARVEIEAVAHY